MASTNENDSDEEIENYLRTSDKRINNTRVVVPDTVIQSFKEDGYIVCGGLIPQDMIDEALKVVNRSIGKGVPKEKLDKFNDASWCPELQKSSVLRNLFHFTGVKHVIDK